MMEDKESERIVNRDIALRDIYEKNKEGVFKRFKDFDDYLDDFLKGVKKIEDEGTMIF